MPWCYRNFDFLNHLDRVGDGISLNHYGVMDSPSILADILHPIIIDGITFDILIDIDCVADAISDGIGGIMIDIPHSLDWDVLCRRTPTEY